MNENENKTIEGETLEKEEVGVQEAVEGTEVKPKIKKKKSFGRGVLTGVLVTILCIFLIAGIALFVYVRMFGGFGIEGFSVTKLQTIKTLIEYYFYEDVDDEELAEGIYSGLLESLDDPYSVYYTEEEYEELMIDTMGNFSGIGATLTKDTETGEVTVVNVYEDSPAEQAGIRAGDIIISADGVLGTDEDLDSFVQNIRGEEGTTVEIVYERDGETTTVEVTRAQISITSVTGQMVTDEIGYVLISEFSSNTKEQFDEVMEDLTSQGMQAVIFDLRYNGGGLLDSVTEILDGILPEGTTVYMLDKYGNRTDYTSDAENYIDIPIVVLTSENTASAAEIFAGAIRDFEYGTLIGTTTFGKGIVQSTIQLSDGSAIKLTVATYYTPSGECIHEIGITPDIELEYEYTGDEDADYSMDYDNQIQKAIEVLQEQL